jgi:hypothetical protein
VSKTEIKQTRVTLQIEENEKWWQEQTAKLHGLSYSALLRSGARLKGQFSPGFLDALKRNLEDVGITVAAFLELTVKDRLASQKAWLNVFGVPAPGIMRQFKWKDGKLIKGEELSQMLEAEYEELYQQLKGAMVEAIEEDKPFHVSTEQAQELMALR